MIFQVEIQFKNGQTRSFTANQRPFIDADNMLTVFEPGGGMFMCHKHGIASIQTRPLEDSEDSFRDSKCEANGTG